MNRELESENNSSTHRNSSKHQYQMKQERMLTQEEESVFTSEYYDEDPMDRTKRYFGEENLQKLKESTLLCVGAGAVGNEVCKNLAMLGIGHIILVDFDEVRKSNINRCVFFRPEDHKNTSKVEAIEKRLPEVAPQTKITSFNTRIEDAPPEVYNVDLIILAVDNDFARYNVNMFNLMKEKPLPIINGAMGRTFIEVGIYYPGKTACPVCLWSEDYYRTVMNQEIASKCDEFFVNTRSKFPMISTLTSIVGGIMSVEATKVLLSKDQKGTYSRKVPNQEPHFGTLIRYDLAKQELTRSKILPNPKCVDVSCRARIKQ
ncbi:hypothetical protein EU523_01300 [Candidatus Heimdallarchaeota archaeon]|nr:MAG: hypothetical protein EU523_01300 [Candidatus Heimdallarchaeota archaeon]